MTGIEEYYQDFMNSIIADADAQQSFKQEQFFNHAIQYLIEDGVLENPIYTPYQNNGMKIDGYEHNEERGVLTLLTSNFEEELELSSLTQTEIDASIRKIQKMFTKSLHKDFYTKLEETSDGYEVAHHIYSKQHNISEIKIILLSNKAISSRVKSVSLPQIENCNVSLDIWDINRFFQTESTKGKTEAIEIDFENEFQTNIPTLAMESSTPDCQSYLCIISGEVLADLYEQYGARLLEANIRTFLQFRAKINKGIRKTIREEPEMFFAYNNGITATAEHLELDAKTGNIIKLSNLQIVNGGQTTASLFNTRLRDKADLSKVYVQMKLSKVNEDLVHEVVPNISKFANTQNKVSDSDFFANHEFHRRFEEQSRRIWAPVKPGSIKQTKWFYERARGQYLEKQSNLTDAKKKAFKEIHPKPQMFTKTDLAKVIVMFEKHPNHAVKGAQIAFKFFADKVVKQWESNDAEFNDLFFNHAVSKIIIYNAAKKIIAGNLEIRGQDRAVIIAYTLYAIILMTERIEQSINYTEIWNNQHISPFLEEQIEITSNILNKFFITRTEEIGTTVLSYSKTEACLINVQQYIKDNIAMLKQDFISSLVIQEILESDKKQSKSIQKIDNGIEAQKKALEIPKDVWQKIILEGKKLRIVTPKEMLILNHVMKPNNFPSEQQSLILVELLEKAQEEGIIAA